MRRPPRTGRGDPADGHGVRGGEVSGACPQLSRAAPRRSRGSPACGRGGQALFALAPPSAFELLFELEPLPVLEPPESEPPESEPVEPVDDPLEEPDAAPSPPAELPLEGPSSDFELEPDPFAEAA